MLIQPYKVNTVIAPEPGTNQPGLTLGRNVNKILMHLIDYFLQHMCTFFVKGESEREIFPIIQSTQVI